MIGIINFKISKYLKIIKLIGENFDPINYSELKEKTGLADSSLSRDLNWLQNIKVGNSVKSNEVVALQGYIGGKYVFGLNSDNESESSTIYSIGPGDVTKTGTIARTYSTIINIIKSPD